MAQRIQRRRTKGWRMPEGAVYVGRGSIWGNPIPMAYVREFYNLRSDTERRAELAALFHDWLTGSFASAEKPERRTAILENIEKLHGRDLACWCPLDGQCHADVLLRLANR